MRLVRQGDRFVAQFSFVWEVTVLTEREEGWVPLFMPGRLQEPIGAIHSQTHEIHLVREQDIAQRQVVILGISSYAEPPQ
jgi:hypothetical protein